MHTSVYTHTSTHGVEGKARIWSVHHLVTDKDLILWPEIATDGSWSNTDHWNLFWKIV